MIRTSRSRTWEFFNTNRLTFQQLVIIAIILPLASVRAHSTSNNNNKDAKTFTQDGPWKADYGKVWIFQLSWVLWFNITQKCFDWNLGCLENRHIFYINSEPSYDRRMAFQLLSNIDLHLIIQKLEKTVQYQHNI